jgi:hypothetical protein
MPSLIDADISNRQKAASRNADQYQKSRFRHADRLTYNFNLFQIQFGQFGHFPAVQFGYLGFLEMVRFIKSRHDTFNIYLIGDSVVFV